MDKNRTLFTETKRFSSNWMIFLFFCFLFFFFFFFFFLLVINFDQFHFFSFKIFNLASIHLLLREKFLNSKFSQKSHWTKSCKSNLTQKITSWTFWSRKSKWEWGKRRSSRWTQQWSRGGRRNRREFSGEDSVFWGSLTIIWRWSVREIWVSIQYSTSVADLHRVWLRDWKTPAPFATKAQECKKPEQWPEIIPGELTWSSNLQIRTKSHRSSARSHYNRRISVLLWILGRERTNNEKPSISRARRTLCSSSCLLSAIFVQKKNPGNELFKFSFFL